MVFDELNIPGDDSDYKILEKVPETVSLNDTVWVETKKEILQGKVMQIPFSDREEYSQHLKIKWIYSRKKERVLIKLFH